MLRRPTHRLIPAPAAAPRRPRVLVAAAVSGLVALLCGLALPFAPVLVSTPTVSWPRDPGRVESTLLPLTAARPLGLDVRFGCDTVRAAAAVTGGADGRDGLVLATALPGSAQAAAAGLVVATAGDRLTIRARGTVLLDEPVPAGSCGYRIEGRSAGRPSDVRGAPTPVSGIDPGVPIERAAPAGAAGPDNAELVVRRDGALLARAPAEQLPDVDLLVSGLDATPPGGLAVTLRVDEEASSRPTAAKMVLIWGLGAALLVTLGLLVVADWGRAPRRRRPRSGWAGAAVDAGVLAAIAVWTLVAPATDDDGYFAVQARNAVLSGGVGDYFQFDNRSFTPFTWPYLALGGWIEWVGTAPVLLRLPAAVAGVVTWWLASRLAAGRTARPALRRVAVAVAFLAWWLPYDMGVRPEGVVALGAVAAAAALLAAARRRWLALAWLGTAAAAAAAAAHPTGLVAVAVLVAGAPLLARVVRDRADSGGVLVRGLAVASGLAVAPLLGFADGALRDVLRGRDEVAAVLAPDGWADEIGRYAFLLDPIPMGAYAKRAAVLSCLLGLVWFGGLAVAARARRVALPVPLAFTAAASALGFAALWLTPSKWTHHFGALAGVGAAFLGLLLVTGVQVARAVLGGRPPPAAVVAAVAGSAAVLCALVWRGPNSWAYAWLEGVPWADRRPGLAGVTVDHPLLWAAGIGLVAVGVWVVGRRRTGRGPAAGVAVLAAVAVVLAGSLAAAAASPVAVFGLAGLRGTPPGAPWVQNLADPAGARCGAAGAVHVLDPGTARPLAALGPPGPLVGFVADGGYFGGDRPPPGPVWGSFTGREGQPGERTDGTAGTAWYALPAPSAASAVVVAVAGNGADGIALTAVYGRRAGADVVPVARTELADRTGSPHWRTVRLEPPPGVDAVRLDAVDGTDTRHGWLAFTAPAVLDAVPLAQLPPPGAPVALGWQLAFHHPCLRPPAVRHGITEPPAFAVLRTAAPAAAPLSGLADIAWQPDRGGVFAGVPRAQSVLQLATLDGDPYLQVYAFTSTLARDGYRLVPGARPVSGLDRAAAGAE